MNLVPYHSFEVRSPLRPAEALDAIRAVIEPYKITIFRMPSSANDRRFFGSVSADGFELTRIIGYRNSALPHVVGTVSASGSGSMVRVRMVLRHLAIAAAAIITFVALAFAVLLSTEAPPSALLFAPIMIVLLYVACMIGFWMEATRQEATLRAILRAA